LHIQDAFNVLCPPSSMAVALQADKPEDAATLTQLRDKLGEFFTAHLAGDREQAKRILDGDQDLST
jgi:hypothetical protein